MTSCKTKTICRIALATCICCTTVLVFADDKHQDVGSIENMHQNATSYAHSFFSGIKTPGLHTWEGLVDTICAEYENHPGYTGMCDKLKHLRLADAQTISNEMYDLCENKNTLPIELQEIFSNAHGLLKYKINERRAVQLLFELLNPNDKNKHLSWKHFVDQIIALLGGNDAYSKLCVDLQKNRECKNIFTAALVLNQYFSLFPLEFEKMCLGMGRMEVIRRIRSRLQS